MLNEKLHDELAAFLKENYHEFDEESKCFFDEAYTDYDDYVSDKDLGKVLDSDDPEQAFEEMLWDCYTDCEWQYRSDIVSEFLKTPEGSKYDFEEVDDELVEMWYFKVPEEHYLKQEVNVDIVVDTGDMNYDYTLNAVYPHYNGREDDEIDNKASLVWLAKTQSYTNTNSRLFSNVRSVGSQKNLRFTFPIIFRPQKHRLNTNTARKKTKKVNIGGRAIVAEACM